MIWPPPKKGDYGYGTDECGKLAWWRSCHRPGVDKGSYSPGRGYTSYHGREIKVCETRCFYGCPMESWVLRDDGTRLGAKPDPDWAAAWRDISSMRTGVTKARYIAALVEELIAAVAKWRSIAEEEKR